MRWVHFLHMCYLLSSIESAVSSMYDEKHRCVASCMQNFAHRLATDGCV